MAEMKSCEICGELLPDARSYQRYCKECGKHPDRARAQLARSIVRNKAHAGELDPIFRERECKYCGKLFHTSVGRLYCSDVCETSFILENARCVWCGGPMEESGKRTWTGYCSDACKREAQIDRAKKKGTYIPCAECGREFISTGPSNACCSRACALALQRKKRAAKVEVPIVPYVYPDRVCPECGTSFSITKTTTRRRFCTPECQKKALKEKQKAKQKPKHSGLQAGQTTHLCITCKTSYAECEWMQSKFRYLPKNAKMKKVGTDKYIVCECPKHTK